MFKLSPVLSLFLLTSCIMNAPTDLQFSSSAIRSPASLEYQSNLQVADRQYVESVIATAFNTANTSDGDFLQQLTIQRYEFGGSCDRYEASEINGNIEFPRAQCFTGLSANTQATSNPARYSLTIQICERMINTPDRFNSFMSKIYGTNPIQVPTNATIQKAYGIFFKEEIPTNEVATALKNISPSSTPAETWKNIATALCISPEWQIL
jgi:hypothetical protein